MRRTAPKLPAPDEPFPIPPRRPRARPAPDPNALAVERERFNALARRRIDLGRTGPARFVRDGREVEWEDL